MKSIHTPLSTMVAVFVVYGASAMAGENQSVFTGYFEGGAVPGRFVYKDNPDGAGLLIDYYSPSLKKILPYRVAKYDECSAMAMYEISNTRHVAIDGSCSSVLVA